MPSEHDGYEDLRFSAPYNGVVTRRDDPLKIGRVRVMVPGLLEPESGWALPMTVGGGGAQHGVYFVPKEGSEVLVFFKQGDIDHPYYTPSNWRAPRGASELNERVTSKSPSEAPKVKVIETERWLFVMDDSADTPGFVVLDKQSAGLDTIEFNGLTRSLTIKATAKVTIESAGILELKGLVVTINNRPVLTSTDPI